MVTNAQKKASAKYDTKNTKLIVMKLNIKTDNDILEQLSTKKSKQGYIKELIRKDMKKKAK